MIIVADIIIISPSSFRDTPYVITAIVIYRDSRSHIASIDRHRFLAAESNQLITCRSGRLPRRPLARPAQVQAKLHEPTGFMAFSLDASRAVSRRILAFIKSRLVPGSVA